MLGKLADLLRMGASERALRRRVIPDALWNSTLERYPFLCLPGESGVQRLRELVSRFLDQKEFSGAHGLQVSDAMAVAIAAQACLPVLNVGLQVYAGFVGIVVHPAQARAVRQSQDDDGVVHEYEEVLTGEAVHGGPVMLSWPDVAEAGTSAQWGYNVVIHEFAHVLDMSDGRADGMPPLPNAKAMAHWQGVLLAAFDQHCLNLRRGEDTLLDAYGAEGVEEFFAVAVEQFFVAGTNLLAEHPWLYAMFCSYFQQDPASAVQARE